MKKTIAIVIFVACAFSAGAQSMYDAMTFSQNNYTGSARTLALGNAVTAVGGDLGTVGINPAGSAVSYYSQFTISPGVNISAVSSSVDGNGANKKSSVKMTMPNFGVSMAFPTGNDSGLKNVTFAFVANQTNNYNMSLNATWRNGINSKLAEFASAANSGKYDESVLADDDSFGNYDVPWDILTAYQSGMFGSYQEGDYGGYVGNTEVISPDGSYHYVPGELQQTSSIVRSGSKNDILINLGFNFNDNFYLGFNLGVPTMSYSYSEIYSEAPVNQELFPIEFTTGETYFSGATYDYQYIADISGIYAKAGFIWLPTKSLRLGAAIQSPTMMIIKEGWLYGATTEFADSGFNGDASSPEGEYTYGLRTPYSFNLGAAYTFGQKGFLSVDYEMTDFSVMKFRDVYSSGSFSYNDAFEDVNMANKNFCGLSHQLRIGGEYKLTPAVSLRAGYSFATGAERHWRDSDGNDVNADYYISNYTDYSKNLVSLVSSEYYRDLTQTYSLGAGYSSPGSFFADFALRATSYPSWEFSPYYDYDGYNSSGEWVEQSAPRISNSKSLIGAVLTIGWRF